MSIFVGYCSCTRVICIIIRSPRNASKIGFWKLHPRALVKLVSSFRRPIWFHYWHFYHNYVTKPFSIHKETRRISVVVSCKVCLWVTQHPSIDHIEWQCVNSTLETLAQEAMSELVMIWSCSIVHDDLVEIYQELCLYSDAAVDIWTHRCNPWSVLHNKASTNVITVPPGAKNSSLPTLQPQRSGYDPAQLWKFIPTKYDVNLLIQNYSLDGNGLVLDCNDGGVGKQCHMWCRGDDNNDNQKSYMKI